MQPHAIAEIRILTPLALLQESPGLTSVRLLSTNRFREMRAGLPEFTAEHAIFTMAIQLFGIASTYTVKHRRRPVVLHLSDEYHFDTPSHPPLPPVCNFKLTPSTRNDLLSAENRTLLRRPLPLHYWSPSPICACTVCRSPNWSFLPRSMQSMWAASMLWVACNPQCSKATSISRV
jgi:hypothetical protein